MSEMEGFQDNITASTTPICIARGNADRLLLKIKNIGATAVYLGFNKTVSSTDGYQLAQHAEFKLEKSDGYKGEVYAVTDTGTADVRILQA